MPEAKKEADETIAEAPLEEPTIEQIEAARTELDDAAVPEKDRVVLNPDTPDLEPEETVPLILGRSEEQVGLFRSRQGRFSIPAKIMLTQPDTAQVIMGQCLVMRCEHMMHSDTLEYMALSERFRSLTTGEMMPLYTWTIRRNEKGVIDSIEAKEIRRSDST